MSADSKPLELYEVGENLSREIWVEEIRLNSFLNPEGQPLKLSTKVVNDQRVLVSFVPQGPGHYSLNQKGRTLYSFAVNCSPEEADLRAVDVANLTADAGESAFMVSNREQYEELKRGERIFHWFLLACVGLLILEVALFQIFRRLAV
jgi:hypothetical protein